MCLDVLVDLLTRQIRGIKSLPRRHGFCSDEWLISVNEVEARRIDPQITAQREVALVSAGCQRLVQRQSGGIALPPVDAFEVAARLHQFANQLLVAGAQSCGPKRHGNGSE